MKQSKVIKSTKLQKEIEYWEHYQLEQMTFLLLKDSNKMIEALNSKDEIKSDWLEVFKKKSTDIDKGAERIYFWLLNQIGVPNSTPIGADLMYETSNAFIHIDVKTSSYNTVEKKTGKLKVNSGDFRGIVSIGQNQTSYKYTQIKQSGEKIQRTANLPFIYKSKNKYCLTYVIHLVHDKEPDGNLKTLSINLICIPNGLLHNIYGNSPIFGGSKVAGEAFRFRYKHCRTFYTLKKDRFRLLYLDKDLIGQEEKILDFKLK